MFPERPGTYAEDFMWMAPDGLRYYLPAAFEYLQSGESKGDWEFCHGLLCSLSMQVEQCGSSPDLLRTIRAIADYASLRRSKYQIEPGDELFSRYIRKIRLVTPAS